MSACRKPDERAKNRGTPSWGQGHQGSLQIWRHVQLAAEKTNLIRVFDGGELSGNGLQTRAPRESHLLKAPA